MTSLESLESRTLFAAAPTHVQYAERLVTEITPANNVYSYTTSPLVTLAGVGGATKTQNKSDCSSFTTELLQLAYGFTDAQMTAWTGEADPEAEDIFDAAVAERGYDGFKNISGVVVGDLFVSKYSGSNDTGHVVTIVEAPAYQRTVGREKVYTLTIIDCTSSPHGAADTRRATGDTGVGRGKINVYTDLSGNLTRWSWNNYVSGIVYDPAVRAPLFAHVPKVTLKAPSGLYAKAVKATSATVRWQDNSANEAGFVLQRRVANGTWATIAELSANAREFTDTSVKASTTYEYRVAAVNGLSQSPWSVAVRLKTLAK